MGRKNSNEIGGSGSQVKVVWNDYNVSKLCDLCINLVDAGRRPNTHFDREGWESLLWKDLIGKETGLGWNPSKGNVDASVEWWHSKIQVNPDYAKFCKKGLNPELEEKLERMFATIIATGEHAWAPSCGNLPAPVADTWKDDVILLEGSDDSEDSTQIGINGGKEGVSKRGKKRMKEAEFLKWKRNLRDLLIYARRRWEVLQSCPNK
ncbi:hypothetical protein ACLB2K_011271 [Fragaria x ananassa]